MPPNGDERETREPNDGADVSCDTCGGSGKIRNDTTMCPGCGGGGKVTPGNGQNAAPTRAIEWRRNKAEVLMKGHLERREFPTSQVEMRDVPGGSLRFTGYASMTGVPYPVGFYSETIQRGAFKRTLGEQPDVQLLINHGDGGSGMPIARTGRNMTLTEDERGLKVEADLDPEDPDVQLLARKLKNGLVDQMSFAFQATDQDWNDDYSERTIKACSIHRGDVSVVNQGANDATFAAMRSAKEALEFLRGIGPGIIDALEEWRNFTLIPCEERAGKALSNATMETLSQILNLVSSADDAVDKAQPMLADLMGVPNPDAGDDDKAKPDDKATASQKADPSSTANTDAPGASTSTDGSSRAAVIDLDLRRKRDQRRVQELKRGRR